MADFNEVNNHEVLVEIKDLCKYFEERQGFKKQNLKAVNHVSFEIRKGETLGLVGESGCGKSTLGRTVLRMIQPTSGSIIYEGKDITGLSKKEMFPYRKKMGMIFQDPFSSLDPKLKIGQIIKEPMEIHSMYTAKEREEKVTELLETVGLMPDHKNRYPSEFSGGQRQRIVIARALALNPEFIVCDEPISALDVSIQAQIMNLLEKIQAERKISYLFIAHDLSMVNHISHRIGVMYLGNLVEIGPADEIYQNPMHPYTKALLSAEPIPDPKMARKKESVLLEGEVPSPLNPPKGCPFVTRCTHAMNRCKEENPEWKEIAGRRVSCHLDFGEH
ncbi:MAG: dipeptide ABC transporter ATP-binding protein [Lachnospiraceae bacterium]|nr:dipeptide ABC transporter ATP-binding protein [Lachnospiraceae bacterium]